MTTQEIIDNAITELTENALSVRRKSLPENNVPVYTRRGVDVKFAN